MKRWHVVHEYVQTNHAEPSVVFPLLCPVREAEWVPGWKYRLLHSDSGFAEPGCVFTTPNDNGVDSVWICAQHDPQNFEVAYTWVWPQMIATRLTIRLTAAAASMTTANIRYEYTALSEAGDREVERFDRKWFESKMKGWEVAINHYLETGRCMDEHAAWE
jgi:hypothetical protein